MILATDELKTRKAYVQLVVVQGRSTLSLKSSWDYYTSSNILPHLIFIILDISKICSIGHEVNVTLSGNSQDLSLGRDVHVISYNSVLSWGASTHAR